MNKCYTGIGSRSTPEDVCHLMSRLAVLLERDGYTLRTGGAGGADSAFMKGANRFTIRDDAIECYVPWQGFVKNPEWKKWETFIPYNSNEWRWAEELASSIHPAWERCSQGAQKLHTRNVFQVLGTGMGHESAFSKFVLFWAEEDSKGNIKGGTRTAVELARRYGIKTANLFKPNVRQWAEEKVGDLRFE